jgi:hypothetical protein
MEETGFAILRYEVKVPAMACCRKCQRKFFTPKEFNLDRIGAEEYPWRKFVAHKCPELPDSWG